MSKKSKLIILISIIAVVAIAISVVAVIFLSKPSDPSIDGEETELQATGTVTEREPSYSANVLHKVEVKETDNVFIDLSGDVPTTQYSIVYGNDEASKKMASFMSLHIGKATGVIIDPEQIVESDVYSPDGKTIYINCPAQFAQAGLSMPEDNIGQTGYYIKSVDGNVFVATNGEYGTQHAGICLLGHLIGYDMYGADAVVYKKSGATMPEMTIIERPDFDFYVASNKVSSETMYGMGFQDYNDLFINITSAESNFNPWHNALDYLPDTVYREEHPDWYSTESYPATSGITHYDICYTAHGNEDEYNALVEAAFEVMMEWIYKNPTIPTITFTIEDHNTVCQCDACKASAKKYNGSNAAAVIQFLNKINDKIQKQLQADADASGEAKRELNLLFFAYHKMLQPPVKRNTDGTWSPIDETVVCGENLGVYLAPIEANYGYSFYDEENEQYKNNCEGWGACTDIIYMWTYNTNFNYYMYPCNTFDDMIENYRFFKELGSVYMWSQGQHNNNDYTHFSRFKDYVNSKALFDTSVNMKELTDDYFANYFMDANQPMREYYDQLQAHLTYLQEVNYIDFTRVTHAEIAKGEYWPAGLLNQWSGYIDEAYKSIEKYKATDIELYNKLYDRINIESIFIRYVQLTLQFGSYTDTELYDLRVAFKADCEKYGITYNTEWGYISDVFVKWGLQ